MLFQNQIQSTILLNSLIILRLFLLRKKNWVCKLTSHYQVHTENENMFDPLNYDYSIDRLNLNRFTKNIVTNDCTFFTIISFYYTTCDETFINNIYTVYLLTGIKKLSRLILILLYVYIIISIPTYIYLYFDSLENVNAINTLS